jgi:redox-sensitive bicupin YhaK (pirin superfamily)
MGLTGVLRQGDFQRTTAGTGLRYSEVNASSESEAHVFQLWLRPDRLGLAPGHERKKFTFAERRGVLKLVASPTGLDGSLSIHQDAYLYSAILAKGQHVVHTIGKGRGAWVHIVQGSLSVGDVDLETGDGVGLREETRASMFVSAPTEILLLDLGDFEANRMTESGRGEAKPQTPKNHGDNGAQPPKFIAEFL